MDPPDLAGHDMLIVATRNWSGRGHPLQRSRCTSASTGRSHHGVRAIRLAEGDEVVGCASAARAARCSHREHVTENGKGRRSDIDTYSTRITAQKVDRGGKGIRNYDAAKDKVAAVKIVDDVDDVLLSSQEEQYHHPSDHANEIPLQSRYGSGVRVMRSGRGKCLHRENDKVMVPPAAARARTDHDDEAQTEQSDRHLRCRCRTHRRAACRRP